MCCKSNAKFSEFCLSYYTKMKPELLEQEIFKNHNYGSFNRLCLEVFAFQANRNPVYKEYLQYLGTNPETIKKYTEIPFLPIDFFKSQKVQCDSYPTEIIFTSSSTSGLSESKHHVAKISLYRESYLRSFQYFYGPINEYCILALLPSYSERTGSSLIYMVDDFIKKSQHPQSGYFLYDLAALKKTILQLEEKDTPTILLGVSYALLDFAEQLPFKMSNVLLMETGGMKGKRKELLKPELHKILKKAFGVSSIHSEYGMTEVLSQAYSQGGGIFSCPPWMKVLIRESNDPLTLADTGKTGGINIIDLANLYSCSFIATQDLGRLSEDDSFEIMGRFDHSDIRGCNLLVQ